MSDSNELILIDFVRSSTTIVIAGAEIKDGKCRVKTRGITHSIYTVVNLSGHFPYRSSTDTAELADSKGREVRSILD